MTMKTNRFLPAVLLALAVWGCGQNNAQPTMTPVAEAQAQPVEAQAPPSAAEMPAIKGLTPKQLFTDLQVKWPKNRTINMVFHGHSIPSGYHKTPEVRPFDSYPFLVYQGMNERFPTAVINQITTAIGGEASPKGAARFERDVLPYHPDLVFIDYAVNDRSFPLDKVEASWRSMIEVTQKQGIPLILLTPTGTRFDNFKDPKNDLAVRAELIRNLGREYKVPVADVSAAWQKALDSGIDQESLLSQGLHPNRKGHEIAAAEILKTIDAMRANAENAPA